MSDGWLAFTWVAIILVIGGVVATWLRARADGLRAEAALAVERRYQEAITAQTAANAETAASLNRLDERLAAIESLLRDVG